MNDQESRVWWPFEVIAFDRQTDQHKAELDFLTGATDLGCRPYKDGSDFGAVAADGAECRIVWHGNHRRELLLIDRDGNLRKQMFASPEVGSAFKQAADVGISFLGRAALVRRQAV